MRLLLFIMSICPILAFADSPSIPKISKGKLYLNSAICNSTLTSSPLYEDFTIYIRQIYKEFPDCTGEYNTCVLFDASFYKESRLHSGDYTTDGGDFKIQRFPDNQFRIRQYGTGGGTRNCSDLYCPYVGIEKVLKWEEDKIVATGYKTGCADGAILTFTKEQPENNPHFGSVVFPEAIFGVWEIESIQCKSGNIPVIIDFERSLEIKRYEDFTLIANISSKGNFKLKAHRFDAKYYNEAKFNAFRTFGDDGLFLKPITFSAGTGGTDSDRVLGSEFRAIVDLDKERLRLLEWNLTCKDLTGFGDSVATYSRVR